MATSGKALFRYGDPVNVEYTAGASIAAGDVVLVGNLTGWTCGIAHDAIANAAKGSLAAGGGVYEVVNLSNGANGAKVYWDGTKASTTSTNNATFGFIVSGGGGGANSAAYAIHKPYV
jgi:predicted RecA/RadA family phage recombinase